MVTRALAFAVLAAIGSGSVRASAQPERAPAPQASAPRPAADVARARELYAAGLALIENGRWADALGTFRESHRLSGALPALFNVALVLRALGRVREARDTLTEVIRLIPAGDPIASLATVMRAEALSRVAAVVLEGVPPRGRARIRFDGSPADDGGERPLVLEADPGRHAVTVLAPGHDPFEWQGTLADGERRRLRVELEETGAPLWPWIAAGAALATVITTVLIVVAVGDSGEWQANVDPTPE
jgi:hypothetical protein